ncbi:MAG TPA: hypothetical protein VGH47_08065 [Xanthobacteraceae bacterium]
MIQQVTLNGRPAIASYLNNKFEPVDNEQLAELVKIRFTDAQGETLFLVPKAHSEPPQHKVALWRVTRARAERLLRTRREFDPDEPRDDQGKWTSDGGGDGGGDGKEPSAGEGGGLDPKVIAVGGDQWNKATARRLEREYQDSKSAMAELERRSVGQDEPKPGEDEDEEGDFIPEEWDQMSTDLQDQAFEAYKEQNVESYIDSEKNNWYDNGDALDDAKSQLVETTLHGPGADHDEWLIEAIDEFRGDYEDRIPFTTQQLIDAIGLEYQSGYSGEGKFTVEFQDDKLKEPANLPPPSQQTLPGIEAAKPEAQLTQKMRDDLSTAIETAFDKKADDMKGDMEPPDYFADSANEFISEDWEHNMSDKKKFEWTKDNTSLLEDKNGSSEPVSNYDVVALPKQYDPLNNTSGEDYQRTQALARYLSVHRAAQILEDRKLIEADELKDKPAELQKYLRSMDSRLWNGWKQSSTNESGKLLQLAVADELGGRLNEKTSTDINANELKAYANGEYEKIGGYLGVKAYVRAKWETTQYLLDKAGVPTLNVFRGIRLEPEQFARAMTEMKDLLRMVDGTYEHLPTLHVARNGAASTTVNPDVANDWGSQSGRVVLRAQVPRTAAVSVPAYGINVHGEKEVVVAGTAWHGWDAWAHQAPTFDRIPELAA